MKPACDFDMGLNVIRYFFLSARRFFCSGLLIFLFSFSIFAHATPPDLSKDTFVIGAVSKNAKKHIEFAQPLVNYLVANMADLGIVKGRVVVTRSLEEMGEKLRSGEVDIVSETVFSAFQLREKNQAEFLLKRWKKGLGVYSSVIFVRKGGAVNSLDDLKGKVIAFEDRDSTSGFFIPIMVLRSLGYELVELDSPGADVPEDKIGYILAEEQLKTANEISISSWVFRGVVDAGAFSSVNWNDPEDMPLGFRNELNIIHESLPFPRSIQLVRSELPPKLKARIQQLLLTAHESEAGKKALKRYQKTSKFELFDDHSQRAIRLAERYMKSLVVSAGTASELTP